METVTRKTVARTMTPEEYELLYDALDGLDSVDILGAWLLAYSCPIRTAIPADSGQRSC